VAWQNFEEILQHLKKAPKRFSSWLNGMVGHLCVCVKLAEVGLNICAGKAKSHSGRQVSSQSCLAKER